MHFKQTVMNRLDKFITLIRKLHDITSKLSYRGFQNPIM